MTLELPVRSNAANKGTEGWVLRMTLLKVNRLSTSSHYIADLISYVDNDHTISLFDIKRDTEVILAIHFGRRPTSLYQTYSLSPHLDALWSLLQSCWRQTQKHRPLAVRYTLEGTRATETGIAVHFDE